VLLFVYIFSVFAAGVSWLIMTSDISGADAGFMGLYMELDAILAVVIGGTPMEGGKYSVGGTVVGVLIIQTLTTTILTKGVPAEYTLLVKALVVIFVLIIQSKRMREVINAKRIRLMTKGEGVLS
jgi:ribose/xylose/arabinose/galactoside ABC-type transport system permease subunit